MIMVVQPLESMAVTINHLLNFRTSVNKDRHRNLLSLGSGIAAGAGTALASMTGAAGGRARGSGVSDGTERELDTQELVNATQRISSALATVLGEAGSALVSTYFSEVGVLQTSVRGLRMEAVFGSLRLTHYDAVVTALGQDAIPLTNAILHVVHTCATQAGGFPLRSTGPVVTLVWELFDNHDISHQSAAALRFYHAVSDALRDDDAVRELLADHRSALPSGADTALAFTFGVNAGWAVEGGLGSEVKFEPAFVGEAITQADDLAHLGRVLGAPCLVSATTIDHLPTGVKNTVRCRCVVSWI